MKPVLSRQQHKFTREFSSSGARLAVSQALRVMLGGDCLRCCQVLNGHRYQIYAMTIAAPECHDALLDFLRKARRHEWELLSRIQDFDPLKDSLQVYALQCPDQSLNVLLVRDPFELFDGDSLEGWEPLQGPEARSWLTLLDCNKWVSFR
jgi:hypothetical protein